MSKLKKESDKKKVKSDNKKVKSDNKKVKSDNKKKKSDNKKTKSDNKKTKSGKKYKPVISDSIPSLQNNGNYFYDLNIGIFRKFWLFLDLIIFSIIYIVLSFLISWTLDKYTVKDLDRSQSDVTIFFEIIAQLLLILLIIYFIIIIVGRYIPNFYPNPPREHIAFKSYVLTILIIFGIFAGEHKFQDKIRHIFNSKLDQEEVILGKVAACYENTNGFTPAPPGTPGTLPCANFSS